MLQTDEDYPFVVPKSDTVAREQKINTSSVIELMLLTRNGDMVFESVVSADGGQTQGARLSRTMSQIEYVQDMNGMYNLPLLGRTNLNGMTLFEAQSYLEKQFAQYFVDPYCVLRIVNNRFIYFSGGGSLSRVVNLPNYRVSIFRGHNHCRGY